MCFVAFSVVSFLCLSAFCRDRDANCDKWKSLGLCDDSQQESHMAIYCGVTCDFCKYKEFLVHVSFPKAIDTDHVFVRIMQRQMELISILERIGMV